MNIASVTSKAFWSRNEGSFLKSLMKCQLCLRHYGVFSVHVALLFKLSNKKKVNDGTINTQPIKQSDECYLC